MTLRISWTLVFALLIACPPALGQVRSEVFPGVDRLQHHVLYLHRPLHRGPRISFHAPHGLPSSTARKADISLAISTGHIMCYRHAQFSAR
jgi:hypothetical protein